MADEPEPQTRLAERLVGIGDYLLNVPSQVSPESTATSDPRGLNRNLDTDYHQTRDARLEISNVRVKFGGCTRGSRTHKNR